MGIYSWRETHIVKTQTRNRSCRLEVKGLASILGAVSLITDCYGGNHLSFIVLIQHRYISHVHQACIWWLLNMYGLAMEGLERRLSYPKRHLTEELEVQLVVLNIFSTMQFPKAGLLITGVNLIRPVHIRKRGKAPLENSDRLSISPTPHTQPLKTLRTESLR